MVVLPVCIQYNQYVAVLVVRALQGVIEVSGVVMVIWTLQPIINQSHSSNGKYQYSCACSRHDKLNFHFTAIFKVIL